MIRSPTSKHLEPVPSACRRSPAGISLALNTTTANATVLCSLGRKTSIAWSSNTGTFTRPDTGSQSPSLHQVSETAVYIVVKVTYEEHDGHMILFPGSLLPA